MVRKTCAPERIINKLREAEIHINQGISIAEASRKISITEQTYYRWRREYGGLRIEQARKLKNLEKENARLKELVADLSLDNAILKEAAEGNFYARSGNAKSSSKSRRSLVFHKDGHVQYLVRSERHSDIFRVPQMRRRDW